MLHIWTGVVNSRQLEVTCFTSYLNCDQIIKEMERVQWNLRDHQFWDFKKTLLWSKIKKKRQKLKVNKCSRCKARENVNEQVHSSIDVVSLWLKTRREFSKPVTKWERWIDQHDKSVEQRKNLSPRQESKARSGGRSCLTLVSCWSIHLSHIISEIKIFHFYIHLSITKCSNDELKANFRHEKDCCLS